MRIPVEGRWGAEAATALFYAIGLRDVHGADPTDARQLAALRDAAGTSEPQVVVDHEGRESRIPLSSLRTPSLSAASTRGSSPPRLQLSALLAQEAANLLEPMAENVQRFPARRHR